MNTSDYTYTSVLWDIEPREVGSLPREFVLRRVLSYGSLRLILDAVKANGFEAVKRVFSGMKQTAFPARKFYYLQKYFFA